MVAEGTYDTGLVATQFFDCAEVIVSSWQWKWGNSSSRCSRPRVQLFATGWVQDAFGFSTTGHSVVLQPRGPELVLLEWKLRSKKYLDQSGRYCPGPNP